MERIQKRIAASGITSRRKAEELILEGRIKVNGEVVNTLGYKVGPRDEVTVDDVVLVRLQKKYYALNKFRIATTADFYKAFEIACHKDLNHFFDGFLNGTTIISSL